MDQDGTPGSIDILVVANDYAFAVQIPEGYEIVGDVLPTVLIEADGLTPVTVTLRPLATPTVETTEAPGYVRITMTEEDGTTAVGGVCVQLTGPGDFQTCDAVGGETEPILDVDPTLGVIELENLPAGDYTLSVTAPEGYEAVEPQSSVPVPPGNYAEIALTFRPLATPEPTEEATPEPPAQGVVVFQILVDGGDPPLGTCVILTGPDSLEVCDNEDGDSDNITIGSIEVSLTAGDYGLEIRPPAGYELTGDPVTSFHLDPDQFLGLDVNLQPAVVEAPTENPTEEPTTEPTAEPTLEPTAEPTLEPTAEPTLEPTPEPTLEPTPEPVPGSLVITKLNADQTEILVGACFQLIDANGTTLDACDTDGESDGETRFENLAAGDWTIHETQAPEGYVAGEDQPITIEQGIEASALVLNAAQPAQNGALAALANDPDGKPLPGACYTATGPDGVAFDGCDDDGDGRADLGEVATGDWLVQQTDPPPGYDPDPDTADGVTVTVSVDQPGEATFVNAPTPPDGLRLPPPLPRPISVVVIGGFQDELGCAQDYDPTCPNTALVESRGIWTGSFPIPPGAQTFRLVTISDAERSLGKGGDENGPDLVVNVPEGSTSVYIEYNPGTGRVIASPSPIRMQVASALGVVELRPIEHNLFEGYFDALAGPFPFQIILNGQPTADEQLELDQDTRIHIVVAADGTIVSRDPVTPTTLTITRTDLDGNPIAGSCFALLTNTGVLLGQICDADDFSPDGLTILTFPDGLQDGSYTLRETLTPEGATPAPDQPIDLVAGDNQTTVTV